MLFASIARTPESTSLLGGVKRSTVVPSPSWPKALLPQQRTPPVVISAQFVILSRRDGLDAREHVSGRRGRSVYGGAVAQAGQTRLVPSSECHRSLSGRRRDSSPSRLALTPLTAS